MTDRHVVVTTDHNKRGVFQGILESQKNGLTVLRDARMAVYWTQATHGVLGLAANGPADGSRIGPAVPQIELTGVTAVIDMTEKAVARWAAEPWTP